MRKTPTALRWMADIRARLSSNIARLEKLEAEIATRLAEARSSLEAVDTTIRVFDSRLDPSSIKPVTATKGKYGKHGALREAITKALKSVAPAAVATDELALMLALEFDFDLAPGSERAKWVKNSLSPTLRAMVKDGLVDRLHDPKEFTSEVGRWRWKTDVQPTLRDLQSAQDKTGVRFRF